MTDIYETNETVEDVARKLADLNTYPCELLIPKTQTQQTALLEKYPSYDGRGIVMAILDTGIDPALPGLQLTTTGERKILDCVDCSGAGDVDTSTIKTAVDGVVIGITGRTLRIPDEWVNPTNKYHLGIKPLHELYSEKLKGVVRAEHKTEIWDPMHQITLADSQRLLGKHEQAVGGTSDKLSEKYEREDLACRVEYLTSVSSLHDKGPLVDCLVWHDGSAWKACLDTSFRGRLKLCTPMGSFRETGEYSFFTDRDKATYSFRIGTKGNHLEVVIANGLHGSHVAGIAAANFPENPKQNGLAPGAKIVSFSIGDNRLDSMETGTALTKAFNMCADYGVQVLNMSFGESTHIPNKGRVIEELQYLVSKHNVVCCISAGNNGPNLSSVGCPGGTTSLVLGIGACLFPSMVDSLYGGLAKVDTMLYPWSSRGPAADGNLGVSICAPGAAYAEVPKYNRNSCEKMNGTSMSSPNAAGAIACLLSALKARDIEWSYLLVRLALENTAAKFDSLDSFSQGNGVLQIENALNYITKHGQFLPPTLMSFEIRCGKSDRGIYMRETFSKHHIVSVSCLYSPLTNLDHMIDFTKNFLLTCEAPWVTIPKTFRVTSNSQNFRVEVDWEKLEPGTANYAEICAIDPENPELGPFFRVPISVIIPVIPDKNTEVEFAFDAYPGIPVRNFVKVPAGATVMDLEVTVPSKKQEDQMSIDCAQLFANTAINYSSFNHSMSVSEVTRISMNVIENFTNEVVITKPWIICDGPSKVRVAIKFRGAKVFTPFVLHHDSVSKKFTGRVAFRRETLKPQIKYLAYYESVKQSAPYKIEPLGPEDVFLNGYQINRLLLTYNYKVAKAGRYSFEFMDLCSYLYESYVDCVRFQIYTPNKEYINSGSVFPARNRIKLTPGDYIIKAQIRHPSVSVLETLRDLNLNVANILANPIIHDFDLSLGQKEEKCTIVTEDKFSFFASHLSSEKLKNLSPKPGSFLIGLASMYDDKMDKQQAYYFFGNPSSKSSTGLSKVVINSKKPVLSEQEKMEEAFRDFQLLYSKNLKDPTLIKNLFDELIAKYPTHIPVYTAKLMKMFEKSTHRTTEELDELEKLVAKIVDLCNPNEILQWLGCRQEVLEDKSDEQNDINRRKDAIIQALLVKVNEYADCHLRHSTLQIPAGFLKKTNPIINSPESSESTENFKDVKPESNETEEIENETQAHPENSVESDPTGDEPSLEKSSEQVSNESSPVSEDSSVKTEKIEEKPVVSAKISREQLDTAYYELLKWIGPDDSRVLLISAKQAVAHEHFGRALKYLEKYNEFLKSKGLPTKDTCKILQEICDILGWVHLGNWHRNEALHQNPPDFRPFQCF
ncbi:unnamed protein product [Auanema sp. JU1783]|nr:unnamed protein product [Auanema sp. JU1783]